MSFDAKRRIEIILDYHERTKHHLDRYARSLGYLDWDTQPYPWRIFDGARRIDLPLDDNRISPPFHRVFSRLRLEPQPLTVKTIGLFLELSLGLTAWKQSGPSRWALRANPSSGNLHPTEGYLFLPPVPGISPSPTLCHYVSRDHFLEERCVYPGTMESLSEPSFFMALTSILWREEWKYGERAFRYCQHDIGHALAAIRIAAACMGWSMRLCRNWNDEDLARWLGTDRKADFADAREEIPECIFQITSGEADWKTPSFPDHGQWSGKANRLAASRIGWPLIASAIEASSHVAAHGFDPAAATTEPPPLQFPKTGLSMPGLIRQRRSAVAFDAETAATRGQLLAMLDLTRPRQATPPFDMGAFESPKANLILFIHRVEGLEPGVYAWIRNDSASFAAALNPEWLWKKVTDEMPLYLLEAGETQSFARTVSCHQDIAADSAFSLGILLPFEPVLLQEGPHAYRHLFWEAGIIGHLFYLGAEALGFRGTGIGCFFDDVMHQALGLTNKSWQSLYHFTVGKPVEDPRLQTLRPYSDRTRIDK